MAAVLGHRVVGGGPCRAMVLNDCIGDTTTWDAVLPLIDGERLTWARCGAIGSRAGGGRGRRSGGRPRPIRDVGHYPMQEAPPLTYTLVERFVSA